MKASSLRSWGLYSRNDMDLSASFDAAPFNRTFCKHYIHMTLNLLDTTSYPLQRKTCTVYNVEDCVGSLICRSRWGTSKRNSGDLHSLDRPKKFPHHDCASKSNY